MARLALIVRGRPVMGQRRDRDATPRTAADLAQVRSVAPEGQRAALLAPARLASLLGWR